MAHPNNSDGKMQQMLWGKARLHLISIPNKWFLCHAIWNDSAEEVKVGGAMRHREVSSGLFLQKESDVCLSHTQPYP